MSCLSSGSLPMQKSMAGTIDMYDDHHIIVGLTSEVDRKIMRCILMLNATRRQLGLPECDLTRMFGHQEKQSPGSEEKDSAVALSKSGSRHSSGEDEIAHKTDDNIPDLNAVNIKLSATAELTKICPVQPRKATSTAPKKEPLGSLLEGVPHVHNAPKMPSLRDLDDSGETNNPGVAPDGTPALINTVEEKRERAILSACVRSDGLNHFISKEEIKAVKARGIERLPVVELPQKKKRSLMQKLRLSRR